MANGESTLQINLCWNGKYVQLANIINKIRLVELESAAWLAGLVEENNQEYVRQTSAWPSLEFGNQVLDPNMWALFDFLIFVVRMLGTVSSSCFLLCIVSKILNFKLKFISDTP